MTALRVPDFRRLWLAGLISDTGDWLLLASLPIVVYQLTGSTLGTAAAFLIELVPPVLLAPVAGLVADRFDRRRTLVSVVCVQAVALLPLLAAHGSRALPIVYAVIAVQSALVTIFEPAKNALLPTLVDADHLVSANSLVGLNQNIGRLAGAPLGGLLLAVGGGLTTITIVDAVTFLAAALLITRLPAVPAKKRQAAATGPRTSLRAALAPRAIRGALVVLFTTSVAQGLFVVLYVVFVARALHGDAAETGLLRGVQAIGSIGVGVLLAAVGGRNLSPVRLTVLSTFAFGLLSLAIWNGPRLTTAEPLFVALFIAVGAPGVAMQTGLLSLVQRATEDRTRGRVFATFGVAASVGQALGMVAGGLLGDPLGVVPVLNGQGTLYLLAGVLGAIWLTGAALPATAPAPPATAPATAPAVGPARHAPDPDVAEV